MAKSVAAAFVHSLVAVFICRNVSSWPIVSDQESRNSGISVLGDVCFLVDSCRLYSEHEKSITSVNQTFTFIFRLTLHLLKDEADYQFYLI